MASSTQMMPGMMGVYNDLLARNTANYQNAIGAYGSGQSNLSAALPGISGAYGKLDADVGGVLGQGGGWGVAQPAANAIRDTLMRNQSQNDQSMISRGLGNSTVRSNVAGQLANDASMAYGNLGSQLADKYAGYKTQIGLAQQAAQMQGLGLQTQLWGQMGGALLNYHFSNTAGGLTGGFSTGEGGGGGGGASGFAAGRDNSRWMGDKPVGMEGALNNSYGSDTRLVGGYQGTPYGGVNQGQTLNFPPQAEGTGLPPAGTPQAEGWGYPEADDGFYDY